MTQQKVMEIMGQHGLYVTALTDDGLIGLTDHKGNVYDVVLWDGNHVIEDGKTSMTLLEWLGY